MSTLGEDLPKEIFRNKQLVEQYKELGAVGNFARILIEHEIKMAEEANHNQDVVTMLKSYNTLKSNK